MNHNTKNTSGKPDLSALYNKHYVLFIRISINSKHTDQEHLYACKQLFFQLLKHEAGRTTLTSRNLFNKFHSAVVYYDKQVFFIRLHIFMINQIHDSYARSEGALK